VRGSERERKKERELESEREGVREREREREKERASERERETASAGTTTSRVRVGAAHPQTLSQLLYRNVKRFRGGLVFKAHSLLYYSTVGLREIKKKTPS